MYSPECQSLGTVHVTDFALATKEEKKENRMSKTTSQKHQEDN
jgi:hypothetical protein